MAAGKEIGKRPPCEENDVKRIEGWLRSQALNGKILFDTAGSTFYFAEKKPEKLVYRLAAVEGTKKQLSEEEKAKWAERGWEYVATYQRFYHIFCSRTQKREKKEAEDAQRAISFQMVGRRIYTWKLWGPVLAALYLIGFFIMVYRAGSFAQAVKGSGLYMLIIFVVQAMLSVYAFSCEKKIIGYLKSAAGGEMREMGVFEENMKKSKKMLTTVNIAMTVTMIAVIFCSMAA